MVGSLLSILFSRTTRRRSLKTRRACARRARGGRLATPADAQGPDGRPHGPLLPGQAAAHQPARLRIIMIPPLQCVLTQNTPPSRSISARSPPPAAAGCHESARAGCPGPRPGRVFKLEVDTFAAPSGPVVTRSSGFIFHASPSLSLRPSVPPSLRPSVPPFLSLCPSVPLPSLPPSLPPSLSLALSLPHFLPPSPPPLSLSPLSCNRALLRAHN